MSDGAEHIESSTSPGFRDRLRGFGPLGLLAIVLVLLGVGVTPPIGALIVVLWVWLSKMPWRDIGYVKPKSWIATIVLGIAFGVALKIAMKAVVMPLLGAPPSNAAFHEIAANTNALLEFAAYAVIGAGWGEETVFRGWLFERLGKLFGESFVAKALIVILGAALFGVAHWQQGLPGIEQATIVGFLFGAIFMSTGRLIPLMFAHGAFDITAALMIFTGTESQFSHLVFK
ncbi:MAG: CPBP family intramembrane metalloprotease [Alphaproteobacteria bacterium]|nr:CPBP family intramembrane metalloprotease [Alphaproteobacteria bacterium]